MVTIKFLDEPFDQKARGAMAAAACDAFKAVSKSDDDTVIADLMSDLLHLARQRDLDPAALLLEAFSHFRSEKHDEDAMPVLSLHDNGEIIAEMAGHRANDIPPYRPQGA